MTYEEKLTTILNAIDDARKNSINTSKVKLYLEKADGLNEFDPNEVNDILSKIERQEKVWVIENVPSYIDGWLNYETCFRINLLDTFDDWYSKQTSQQQSVKGQISFDNTTGTLTINDKSVIFRKDTFRTELLALLMKNKKKIWQWDEVVRKIEGIQDENLLKENKNKFYSACDGLQKFIAQKIGINDFLIFNKSTVQINPKYLHLQS